MFGRIEFQTEGDIRTIKELKDEEESGWAPQHLYAKAASDRNAADAKKKFKCVTVTGVECKSVDPFWKKLIDDKFLQMHVRKLHASNNDEVVIFGCKYVIHDNQPNPITFVGVNWIDGHVYGFSTDEVLTVDEYGVHSMLPITTDLICVKPGTLSNFNIWPGNTFPTSSFSFVAIKLIVF
ncbi:OLC1v1037560C1 [Oldenlandia corymbosa var. corymbosa]|uniref:OLC1v1037560C1 n=1 Tax=Oldenlandia corymbosa var. corymbosa TaxID=529605 RepID=A0AAV1CXS1_OLDCO|nr:OLC1v1037560C1 [Oldenlandia corymbosa var. corymbosa]